MTDTQNTARVQADLCRLSNDSKEKEMFLFSSILYAVGFINITLRTAGKVVSKRLAWDDWILVGALLFTTLPLACVLAMTRIGFGEHLWNLEPNTLLPILRYCKCESSSCVQPDCASSRSPSSSLHCVVHLYPGAHPRQDCIGGMLP